MTIIDYSLYLVTDRTLSRGRSLIEIITAAVHGGTTCVQLREKDCSTEECIELARSIQPFLASRSIPLIINDRVDVALAVDADGVHLGQDDFSIKKARALLPSHMVIGASVGTIEEALSAVDHGADYLGIGPLFATPTKQDAGPPLGIGGIKAIRDKISIPIVAIGGLNHDNIKDILQQGVDGIATVSAIVSADNPQKSAEELHTIITRYRP